MKSLIKPLQDIGVLTVALTFAFVANFAYGQWAEPAVAPTGGNIAVPINVSASNQVKSGGIGASTMAVGNGFAFSFVNTIDGANTAWRLENNDGTGNFLTYLNSLGGTAPTFETTGHAFKEIYSPGEGAYRFLTSSASGAAGGPITWRPAMTITANGNINVNQICDINGSNCSGPGGGASLPTCSDGQILQASNNSWVCANLPTAASPTPTPTPAPTGPAVITVAGQCSIGTSTTSCPSGYSEVNRNTTGDGCSDSESRLNLTCVRN